MLYDHSEFDRHHEIHFHDDPDTGLKAIIAIHRAWNKPSVGGCRMLDYSSEREALKDVLRLSRGMTFKSVMAGVDYGGAKAVIIGTPEQQNRDRILTAMARFVDRLNGRFRTGVDVGLSERDVAVMGRTTSFMTGTGPIAPDEMTAHGVVAAIRSAAKYRFDADNLSGVSVTIAGLGKVGLRLAQLLVDDGAKVFGSDVCEARNELARQMGISIIPVESALEHKCDVLAPCALGGILNRDTIPSLRCSVVAGSANNQLEYLQHAELMVERSILYAPDYIANAGGLIAVAMQLGAESEAWAWSKIVDLGNTLGSIFAATDGNRGNTNAAADRIAKRKIDELSSVMCEAA